jgi:uncharacterized protein (TIGR03067 family)
MNWFPVLGVALVVGAPVPKEAPKKADGASIVGEWVCTKCVADGREFPEEVLKSIQLAFTADGKFQFTFGPDQGGGAYTADPAKDPPEVDFQSDKTGKGNKGIYKADKESMTFCFKEGGGDRPTKFESPAGTRMLLLTLARKKADKD